MPKKQQQELIASIDIGSANILVLIAKQDNGNINIIGTGSCASNGIKKGIVVNIASAVGAVKQAISEAENMAGYNLSSIVSGISGTGIKGLNSNGRISINYDVVDKNDVMRVLQSAEAITLPATQEIIYPTPRSYTIDSNIEVDDPIGMHGEILEAEVHIITNEKSCIKNTNQSVYQCGVDIEDTIPNIIACSQALLSNDEKNVGACVIDIGAGTTDVVIFDNGSICHTEILPICGYEVTTDIMYAFSATQEVAENIKKEYGVALAEMVEEEIWIDVNQSIEQQVKTLSSRTLSEVIEARYEEIFNEVINVLVKSGYDKKVNSIVLTGGGTSIKGCQNLAERMFGKLCRLGSISQIGSADNINNNPSYSVALGLLLPTHGILRSKTNVHWKPSLWQSIKKLFSGNF